MQLLTLVMSRTKRWLPIVAGLLAAGCIHGMDKVMLSTTAPGIPAAQGAVRTMAAAGDTTRLILRVQHLAPPERVQEGATTYVVWTRPEGSDASQNVGALEVDAKKLTGAMMAYVPYDTFEVFVTAEPSPTVVEPTGQQLLWASVDDRK